VTEKNVRAPDEKMDVVSKGTTRDTASRLTNSNKPDDNRAKGDKHRESDSDHDHEEEDQEEHGEEEA
jgi:hypothetical protein